MEHRYIALMDFASDGPEAFAAPAEALEQLGLQCLVVTPQLRIFGDAHKALRRISKGAWVIGSLFARQPGTPDTLASMDAGPSLQQHLLSHYWGEYVLIELTQGNPQTVSALRSPSGGVACMHAVAEGRGFITSDVSIALGSALHERRLDWDYVVQALNFTHLHTTCTGIPGVSELLPGCVLTVGANGATAHTAWSPWDHVGNGSRFRDATEAARSVRDAVSASVDAWAKHDGRLLLELSGGLDSSIVGASLSRTSAHVTCCTLTSPHSGTDERQYARLVSDLLGTDLHTLTVDAGTARFDFAPPEDSATPGMGISHHGADAALHHAALVHAPASFISGAGGDTVFCYLGNASPAADAFREGGLAAGLRSVGDLSTLYDCPLSKALRLTVRKMRRGPKHTRPADHTFLAPSARLLAPAHHPWLKAPVDAYIGDVERIGALVGTQGYWDGMARNRRWPVRLPLLSQLVVETCLRVPTWMWIRTGRNRAVARDAFADLLPHDILHRRSKGTYVTLAGALYAENKHAMLGFLDSGHLNAHGLLDMLALRKTIQSDIPSKDTSFFRIFDLCMIENWIRHQGTAAAPRPGSDVVATPAAAMERQIRY